MAILFLKGVVIGMYCCRQLILKGHECFIRGNEKDVRAVFVLQCAFALTHSWLYLPP